jgi:uncharacterized membrane protein YbhN (UPF0104 family)
MSDQEQRLLVKNWKNWLRLLGPLLFVYVLWSCRVDQAWRHMRALPAGCWFLLVVSLLIAHLLKVWRWHWLLSAQRFEKIGCWNLIRIYLASVFWGMVTPGHIGEFSKMAYLRRLGHPIERTLLNSLLDRLFDVIVLMCFGVAGLAFFVRHHGTELSAVPLTWRHSWIKPVAGVLVLSVMVVLLHLWRPRYLAKGIDLLRASWAELRAARRSHYLMAGLITVMSWTVQLATYVVVGMGMGLQVSPFYLLAVVAAATFSAMLPVSVAGLGVREGVVVLLLSFLGVGRSLALAFAVVFVVVYLLNLSLGFSGVMLVGRLWPVVQESTLDKPTTVPGM